MIEEKINLGDVVYPKGCTREYQRAHPITVNFIDWRIQKLIIDSVPVESKIKYISQGGACWYPVNTITKVLGN